MKILFFSESLKSHNDKKREPVLVGLNAKSSPHVINQGKDAKSVETYMGKAESHPTISAGTKSNQEVQISTKTGNVGNNTCDFAHLVKSKEISSLRVDVVSNKAENFCSKNSQSISHAPGRIHFLAKNGINIVNDISMDEETFEKSGEIDGRTEKNYESNSEDDMPSLEDIPNSISPGVNLYVDLPKFDLGMSPNSAKARAFIEDSIIKKGGNIHSQTHISNSFDVLSNFEDDLVDDNSQKRRNKNYQVDFPTLTREEKSALKYNLRPSFSRSRSRKF